MNDVTEKIQTAVFRETNDTFKLKSYADGQQALVHLFKQANVSIKIYSHSLCPALFNSSTVIEACEQFCLKNHRTQIHIIVEETRPLTQISHRLLSLAHKHSSSIFLKKMKTDGPKRNDDYVCIDRSAYFQLPSSQHYESICNFSDAHRTAIFLTHFNDAWDVSFVDPELRTQLL